MNNTIKGTEELSVAYRVVPACCYTGRIIQYLLKVWKVLQVVIPQLPRSVSLCRSLRQRMRDSTDSRGRRYVSLSGNTDILWIS